MALYLTNDDIAQLLPMKECVDALETVFTQWGSGHGVNRPRTRIRLPTGFHHYMASYAPDMGVLGLRTYTTLAGGGQNIYILYDGTSGQIMCLMDSGLMSTIRTGAASGLGTRHMARADATTVGMIGVGGQAEAQLAAVCAVRDIRHAKVFSRTAENRQAFASEMSEKLGTEVVGAESAEECVSEVDIVITITNSREPVLKGEWLMPGQHINAAGSNHWMRRELDDAAVERSDIIVVDDLEQAKMECGELVFAAERGRFRWDDVHELRDVLAGRIAGRPAPASVTLFESQGLSIEDLATAHHVYHKAREQGMGQELPF